MELDSRIPALLNDIRPGATFLTIKNYQNNYNEIADFQVVFHVNYRKAVEASLRKLERLSPSNGDWGYVAKQELLQSLQETLDGHNSRYTLHGVYEKVTSSGQTVNGVKWYKKGSAIHLNGFIIYKRVNVPGVYPKVISHEKTIEKDRLRDLLPIGRMREFKLVAGRFGLIKVEKMTLTEQDLLSKIL